MICPKCGNETSGNYCSNCGAPLFGGPEAETDRNREMDAEAAGQDSGFEISPECEPRNQGAVDSHRERQPSRKKEKTGGSPKKEAPSRDSSKESQKEKKQLEKRIRTLEEERQQREKEVRRSGRQRSSEEETGLSRKDGGKSGHRRSRAEEAGISRRSRAEEAGISRRSRAEEAGFSRRSRGNSRFSREAEDDFSESGARRSAAQKGGGETVRVIRETEETGGSFADAAARGVTGVVVLMSRIMQLGCFLLMAGMVLASARAFWFCSDGLGNINTMITDRNYSLALYVGAAAFSLFMGVIWCFWILSRKAAGGNIRLKKYDTGRGFIPFILCAAVIFAAGPASMIIPADGAAWHGLAAGAGAVLEAVNSNHGFLVFCSVAGIILSLVRKLLRV